MATLKNTGDTPRTIEVRKDLGSPGVYVTLEVGDELVSVNRAEILAAIGAVEPTTEPTPPAVTRRNEDTVLVGEVAYVAQIGRDLKSYEDEADYYERAGANNRAVANFLRAEQEQAPVSAEIAALQAAYWVAFPHDSGVPSDAFLKMHAAGFRILP